MACGAGAVKAEAVVNRDETDSTSATMRWSGLSIVWRRPFSSDKPWNQRLLRQYLYFCTSTASKLRTSAGIKVNHQRLLRQYLYFVLGKQVNCHRAQLLPAAPRTPVPRAGRGLAVAEVELYQVLCHPSAPEEAEPVERVLLAASTGMATRMMTK